MRRARADRFLPWSMIDQVGLTPDIEAVHPLPVRKTFTVELLDGGCRLIRPERFAKRRRG